MTPGLFATSQKDSSHGNSNPHKNTVHVQNTYTCAYIFSLKDEILLTY